MDIKKYIEQIYYAFYQTNFSINESIRKVVARFYYFVGMLIFRIPRTRKHLAEMGETPESFINKHIEAEKKYAQNDVSGMLINHTDMSVIFFHMFVLLDIILILHLISGYYFLFHFANKGVHFFLIAYMTMAIITCTYLHFVYWKDKKYTKIIRKFRRKSDRQKRIAMRNFWLTVIAVVIITVVLLWYEIDVKTLHKYEL